MLENESGDKIDTQYESARRTVSCLDFFNHLLTMARTAKDRPHHRWATFIIVLQSDSRRSSGSPRNVSDCDVHQENILFILITLHLSCNFPLFGPPICPRLPLHSVWWMGCRPGCLYWRSARRGSPAECYCCVHQIQTFQARRKTYYNSVGARRVNNAYASFQPISQIKTYGWKNSVQTPRCVNDEDWTDGLMGREYSTSTLVWRHKVFVFCLDNIIVIEKKGVFCVEIPLIW